MRRVELISTVVDELARLDLDRQADFESLRERGLRRRAAGAII